MKNWIYTGLLAAMMVGCTDKAEDTGETDTTTDTTTDSGTTDTSEPDTGTTGTTDTETTDTTDTDTTDTDTTVDTGDTGDITTPPECDVDTPRTFTEVTDFFYGLELSGFNDLEFQGSIIDIAFNASGPETCPMVSEILGSIVADAGKGCSNRDGIYMEGKMTAVVEKEDDFTITYDNFIIQIEKSEKGSGYYSANGTLYVNSSDKTEQRYAMDMEEERYIYGAYSSGLVNGHFIRDVEWTSMQSGDGGGIAGSGTVEVINTDDGWTGDYCFEMDLAFPSDCDEPDGTVDLIGAQRMLVTLNGGSECDDCGDISIDGGPDEEFCF